MICASIMKGSDMAREPGLAETAPERFFIRLTAVACIAIACVLLVGEWFASGIGLAPGSLMMAGLVMCLLANILSIVLLVGRKRG
jgi:hypothetical protein